MENAEEIQLVLERYSRLKPKEIPDELEEYMGFVAKTGDTVFKWPLIQHLFREKLMNVITDFHDSSPSISDLPHYPNVDPFNFELMKKNLIERMESFHSAPFTIQRICELLTEPRKQYSRIDKFMRAIEKNILVVSTLEPGRTRHESENGESLDSTVNGDLVSESGNLDVGSSEEEPSVTENVLPTAETADIEPEKGELIDPLAAVVDNPDIDVPLEKLEPEVNVLTVEGTESLLKHIEEPVTEESVASETTTDETQKETTPEIIESSESVGGTSALPENTPETEPCADTTPDETKPDPEASPSKRSIDEVNSNDDENVNKKTKVKDAADDPLSVAFFSIFNSIVDPEQVKQSQAKESTTDTEQVEKSKESGDFNYYGAIPNEIVFVQNETPEATEPFPPTETISESNMEQQATTTPVATTEDEDLMKVDATPVTTTSENKMQTDDAEETTASAMDVDECSGDLVME